jgi:hypothetical protein
MQLNNAAPHEERQLLLPLLSRLVCVDTLEIEREPEIHIAPHVRWHLPFTQGLEILKGALAMRRQANRLSPEMVGTRLEARQQRANAPALVPNHFLFTKIKALFAPVL